MNQLKIKIRPLKIVHHAGVDGFVLALLAMIALAYLYPQGGIARGYFSLSQLAGYGVSGIFFFYGLKLDKSKLRAGLSNWRLHFVIQLSTFVLFPLVILPFKTLLPQDDLQLLWLGTFFLASLPSTVSSSVVMVSIAEGNIPAAIFNASLSGILGIFITPLWMSLVLSSGGEGIDLQNVFGKLITQVLVPVIIGMLLNDRWGRWAEHRKKQLKYFDQTIILMIVYTSFCHSFEERLFHSISIFEISILISVMLALFFLVYFIIRFMCYAMQFSREDKITALFCGSKKSLVHGTVMSKVLLSNSTIGGVLLLPLMIYHALQLVVAGVMANQMVKKENLKSGIHG